MYSIHFVNKELDSGKIILQKKVKINKKDNAKTLAKKILIQEHKLYPRAILINVGYIPLAKLNTDASGVSWYFWSLAKTLFLNLEFPLTNGVPSRPTIKGIRSFMFQTQIATAKLFTTKSYLITYLLGITLAAQQNDNKGSYTDVQYVKLPII